jgi:hypothetical protein
MDIVRDATSRVYHWMQGIRGIKDKRRKRTCQCL